MQDTYTDNLHLKKPDKMNLYDISDFNDNADIIDSAIEGKVSKISNGTEDNLVSINRNGDIVDSGLELKEVLLAEILREYIELFGGIKKYTTAGTFSFKVPAGITQLKVSLIGGGGGGGGGGGNSTYSGVAAGGGGGRGEYLLDQTIDVTPKEILIIIVGAGGNGGNGGKGDGLYTNGEDGEASYIKRNDTILISAEEGKKGYRVTAGYNHVDGGYGGEIDGKKGTSTTGGAGGTTSNFGIYGNGGNGGNSTESRNGKSGNNGAVVIYFGDYQFSDIKF